MEIKEIEKSVADGFKDLEGKVDEKLKGFVDKQKESLTGIIEEKGFTTKEEVETAVKSAKDELEEVMLEIKKSSMKGAPNTPRTFKSILGEALTEKKDALSDMVDKKRTQASFEIKADEDIDMVNWSGDSYANASTEFRPAVYNPPFAPVWLRTLLPNVTTVKGTINYPRYTGANGAAAVWDGSGDIEALLPKPGVSPNFEDVTENIVWIAGITRVKREMLDDVAWLQSFLTQHLTTGPFGLFVAENNYLYTAIDTGSIPYDGTNTIPVEMIYDAAFGQLRDNYLSPSLILMNTRDVVNLIALNKAGNGTYDLPQGTVAVIGNQLMLGGVPVVGTPEVTQGEAYVIDTNQLQFVSRMSPEVRAFEQDRDNVIKNLVTFRAEERIGFINYNAQAIVKLNLGGTT